MSIFKVYYAKNPTFMENRTISRTEVLEGNNYIFVKKIETTEEAEGDQLEDVFRNMQAEFWKPTQEEISDIKAKGLNHTSMSVGDVAFDVDGNKMFEVSSIGWNVVNDSNDDNVADHAPCPLCNNEVFLEDYNMKTAKGFTIDCPHCGKLLLIEDEQFKDFHNAMHEKDSRWPKDGKGTSFIEV